MTSHDGHSAAASRTVSSPDRMELLNALSSGQLLCAAFEDALSASAAANPEGMIELEPE